jgi:Glycosyltransferase 61
VNALMRNSVGRLWPGRLLTKIITAEPMMAPEHEMSDFRLLCAPAAIEIDETRYATILSQAGYFQFAPVRFRTIFLCRFHNCKLHNGEGTLATSANAILLDSVSALYRLKGNTAYGSVVPASMPFLEGRYSSIWGGSYATNIFHWLIECLPRLHSLEALGDEPLTLLMPNSASRYHRESLACCLPKNVTVHYIEDSGWVRVEEFILPCYVTLPVYAALPAEYSSTIRKRVFECFNLPQEHTPKKRIYISRRKAAHRGVRNEPDVVEFLAKLGFQSYLLEDLSFQEQVRLFHSAEIVVAPHGAGLANILFSGAIQVVELQVSPQLLHYFFLSQSLGQQYSRVMGEQIKGDSDFSVPLDKLKEALSTVI